MKRPALISAAKKAALSLADDDSSEDKVATKALELASDNPLTDDQMKTLIKVISDQITKHLKLERIEAKILDEGNKTSISCAAKSNGKLLLVIRLS